MTILVRLLVFVGLYAVALGLGSSSDDVDGLGLGLLLFLVLAVLALVWGFFDGRRHSFARLVVTWAVVAAGTGLAMTVNIALGDGGFDTDVFRADLADTLPFLLGLVGVPALLGGGVGRLTRGRRGTQPTG